MGFKPLDVRFFAKVRSAIGAGCWEWPGSRTPLGYGLIWSSGRTLLAHRVSWELHNNEIIPEGMIVLHSCDNPACVNPAHLSIGRMADNSEDMKAKGRQARGAKIPTAVLDETAVRAIRSLRVGGIPTRNLAAMFGVSQTTVCQVLSGKTWKHVA